MKAFSSKAFPEPHALSAVSVKFSPNGKLVASAGSDKYCHIYDVEKAELIEKISEEYSVGLNDCAWFDNGHIITVGDDCQVRLIDLEVNKTILTYRTQKAVPYSVIVHPFNSLITVGDTDGNVLLYHIGTKEATQKIHAHSSIVSSLAFTQDGEELLTGSYDGVIRQWIPQQRALCIRSIIPSPKVAIPISSISYSPNNKYLLASILDSTHRLYPRNFAESGLPSDKQLDVLSYPSHIKQYTGHQMTKFTSPTRLVNIWGNRYSVLSGSEDGNLFLWDANTQNVEIKGAAHEGVILGVDSYQSAHGHTVIATSSADGFVKIHEIVDNQQVDDVDQCQMQSIQMDRKNSEPEHSMDVDE